MVRPSALGLQVDYQLEFVRLLHRQVGGLLAAQDAVDIFRGTPELIDDHRFPAGIDDSDRDGSTADRDGFES
jgi:hypothetical protein